MQDLNCSMNTSNNSFIEPEDAVAALTKLGCPPVHLQALKGDPLPVPTSCSKFTSIKKECHRVRAGENVVCIEPKDVNLYLLNRFFKFS